MKKIVPVIAATAAALSVGGCSAESNTFEDAPFYDCRDITAPLQAGHDVSKVLGVVVLHDGTRIRENPTTPETTHNDPALSNVKKTIKTPEGSCLIIPLLEDTDYQGDQFNGQWYGIHAADLIDGGVKIDKKVNPAWVSSQKADLYCLRSNLQLKPCERVTYDPITVSVRE
jgi:hypothetical protein